MLFQPCVRRGSVFTSEQVSARFPGAIKPLRSERSVDFRRMSLTAADFRKAMGCFATGVTIITVDQDGEIHGMTANAFTAVSLEPTLVLVCVDYRAKTHAHLHARKRFGVNVLSSGQRTISEYYAKSSVAHQHAEEAGARFDRTAHGTPVLEGALAYLECRLHSTQPAGDHTIFIAEVEQVEIREGEPLLYFRSQYRTMGKPA
jgi:flavin reductase (DIM6/NTAB) family NADH-FMN oxidoreductase RutF